MPAKTGIKLRARVRNCKRLTRSRSLVIREGPKGCLPGNWRERGSGMSLFFPGGLLPSGGKTFKGIRLSLNLGAADSPCLKYEPRARKVFCAEIKIRISTLIVRILARVVNSPYKKFIRTPELDQAKIRFNHKSHKGRKNIFFLRVLCDLCGSKKVTRDFSSRVTLARCLLDGGYANASFRRAFAIRHTKKISPHHCHVERNRCHQKWKQATQDDRKVHDL